MDSLVEWLQSPLGEALLMEEQSVSQNWLQTIFGYHAVHIGHMPTQCILQSRIAHSVFISDKETSNSLRADADALPLKNDSVDLVVLPHVLEFHTYPHEVLREVSRILIPEGILLISGFNPHSLWGLRSFLDKRHAPWNTSFLSLHRIHDWLELLGFTTLHTRSVFFRVPMASLALKEFSIKSSRFFEKYWPLGGAAYMIMAQKRLSTLTPIRLKRSIKRKIVTGWQPSVRNQDAS